MDDNQGRQKRVVKLNKNSKFSYDEESFGFLNYNRDIRQPRHQQLSSDRVASVVTESIFIEGASTSTVWSSNINFTLEEQLAVSIDGFSI